MIWVKLWMQLQLLRAVDKGAAITRVQVAFRRQPFCEQHIVLIKFHVPIL